MKKIILLTAAVLIIGAVAAPADTAASYKKDCAKCHGTDGAGKTKMGKKLKVKDYTDAAVQAKMTDDAMAKAIKEGVKVKGKTRMKAYKYSDEEVAAMVKMIRGFKK